MTTLRLSVVVAMITCVLLPATAVAQSFSTVGHASANFLKIPVEPTGVALGNALVASADGILGLYWNPGALTSVEGTEVIFSRMQWLADTRLSFAGAATHTGPAAIGVSVTSLSMDEMEITTELQPNGTGQWYGAGSYAVGLTVAVQVIDRFSFGGTAKYVHEYIWETKASTWGFDFGSVYTTDFHRLRIGMRIANFGGDMSFSGAPVDDKAVEVAQSGMSYAYDPRLERVAAESPLPQVFTAGISIDPFSGDGHRVSVMAAVNDPNDNVAQVMFGAEYAWTEAVFVRAGYKSGFDEQNVSGGLGVRVPLAGILASADFAYANFGRLGNVTSLSVRLGF